MEKHERALSEMVALIFIAILVVVATLLLIASLTGVVTTMLEKPAFIVVKADNVSIGGNQAIRLFHQQGDPVIVNGTSQTDGVSIISFSLTTPSNVVVEVKNSTLIHKSAWRAGDTLFIYWDGSSYWVSDTIPPVVTTMEAGTWTVRVIDNKVKVLLHSLPVTIT